MALFPPVVLGVFVGGGCGLTAVVGGADQAGLGQVAVYGLWALFALLPLGQLGMHALLRSNHPIGTVLGGLGGAVLGTLLFVVTVAQIGNVFGAMDSTTTVQVVLGELQWSRLGALMVLGGLSAVASAALFRQGTAAS